MILTFVLQKTLIKKILPFFAIGFGVGAITLLYDNTPEIDAVLAGRPTLRFVIATLLIILSIVSAYFFAKNIKEQKKSAIDPHQCLDKKFYTSFSSLGLGIAVILWLFTINTYSPLLFIVWIVLLGIAAFMIKNAERVQNFSFRIQSFDLLFLTILILIVIPLYSYDLSSAKWLSIGDEWTFYNQAKEGLGAITGNLFSLKEGVYQMHPLIASAFQSGVMDIIGHNAATWRFSAQIPVFIATLFLYLALIEIYNRRRYAIAGSILFVSSHYLITFSHIGYNNTQGLIFIPLSILFLSASIKRPTLFNSFMLGLVAGFSVYGFPVAAFIIPVVVITYLFCHSRNLLGWSFLFAGILISILPLVVVNPNIFDIASANSVLQIEQIGNNLDNSLKVIGKNLIATVYSPFAFKSTHFVNGAILDFVTAVLFISGIGICFFRQGLRLLLLAAAIFGLLLGVGSQYHYPSTTRMFLPFPFLIVISCASLEMIETISPRIIKNAVLIFLIALVIFANLYKISSGQNTYHGYYVREDTLLHRYIKESSMSTIYTINVPTTMNHWLLGYFPDVQYRDIKMQELHTIDFTKTPFAIISNYQNHKKIIEKYPPDEIKVFQDTDLRRDYKIYIAEYK